MDGYFWDTGILIGYSLYFDKKDLPMNVFPVEIDPCCEECKTFVDETSASTHAIAHLTANVELKNVLRKITHRVKLLIYLAERARKRSDPFFDQFGEEDFRWAEQKKKLFIPENKRALTRFFLDLVAAMHVRIDYLLRHHIKGNVHKEYENRIKTQLNAILQNSNDAIIFATCIDYCRSRPVPFVTADEKDYGKILSTPEIGGMPVPKVTFVRGFRPS